MAEMKMDIDKMVNKIVEVEKEYYSIMDKKKQVELEEQIKALKSVLTILAKKQFENFDKISDEVIIHFKKVEKDIKAVKEKLERSTVVFKALSDIINQLDSIIEWISR